MKQLFSIVKVFLYFWSNKCSLGEHETSFKNLTNLKLFKSNVDVYCTYL